MSNSLKILLNPATMITSSRIKGLKRCVCIELQGGVQRYFYAVLLQGMLQGIENKNWE